LPATVAAVAGGLRWWVAGNLAIADATQLPDHVVGHGVCILEFCAAPTAASADS